MTATTNGVSLEDCLTNIFSLIDLNGIRWKRFKHKVDNNYLYNPIDTHPILTTYARCIEENHIAVWRHEPQKRHSNPGGSHHGGGGGTGSAGHSNFPTPTRTSNNNTPTGAGPSGGLTSTATTTGSSGNQNNNTSGVNNSNSQNTYELWIFGYGNQLKVDDVVGEDLVEIEDDTWDQKGLSYECRTLLFKALHNLIERCLISKGFTRIGRWFVQPLPENFNHSTCCYTSSSSSNSYHLATNQHTKPFKHLKTEQSSSISPQAQSSNSKQATSSNLSSSIFSTINSFIESRSSIPDPSTQHCLDKSDGLRHTSTRSASAYFTTSLDGTRSSLSFAFSFFVHGDSNICAAADVRQHPLVHPLTRTDLAAFQAGGIVRVALAPYGLNGILNGVSYKDSDNGAATTTFVQQWSKFYPLPKTLARLIPSSKSSANSAITTTTNFHHKSQSSAQTSQFPTSDAPGSRSYLSNLTNMLLPPTNKPTMHFNYEHHEVPPVVEVIVAGFRMRYPSECVFTTSRVVDLYRSLNHLSPSARPSLPPSKRPNKNSPPKPNKLSLLNEKLSDEKTDADDNKIKVEPGQPQTQAAQSVFNSPFKLLSSTVSDGSSKFNTKPGKTIETLAPTVNNLTQQYTIPSDLLKDKTPNGLPDVDSNPNTILRYNTSKVGFNSNNTSLGPTDLVKLFPTPPSLEQIILSPSGTLEESAPKEPQPSPANANETSRDNDIDVYKPVECALMPPPPKWAALTNILITTSKSLPPECIYRGSPVKTSEGKSGIGLHFESVKMNTTTGANLKSSNKQLSSLLDKSRNSPATPSPLTDQTNKNGFNMNPPTPKNFVPTSLLNNPTASHTTSFSPSPNGLPSISSPSNSITSPTTSTFSSCTLPHQRLFNNLNEINSIQMNLMISDTVLGMFQDHNFENCTICVCNMSIKGAHTDAIPNKNDQLNQWKHPGGPDTSACQPSINNEILNECTCGFSAMTNRHYSHLSGLFLEDELEITNVLYDPTEMIDQNKLFRKLRLSTYSEASLNEEQKVMARAASAANKTTAGTTDEVLKSSSLKLDKPLRDEKTSQSNQAAIDEMKVFVIEQLKQQCQFPLHSNSSLYKVLMIESFRNDRHLTNCSNYYAQATSRLGSSSPIYKLLDDTNKYTTVKMFNRNPSSLKFSDFCELIKGLITRLGAQSQQLNSRIATNLVKSHGSSPAASNLSTIFTRMFSPSRQSLIGKSIELHGNGRNGLFAQGLQALVLPTLSIDPKGALQTLEQLLKDESKEALATLNKAILIFSSPIHDWQFLTAPIPENNFDVAHVLKLLQPPIDEAVGTHNRLYKDFVHQQQQHIFSSRDSPTGAPTVPTPPCQGPLTWRQFHLAAGSGTEDQCEPQPIPSLLVSYHVDRNHIALSPFALKFWDKLLLEPYAPSHNIFYLVIAPKNQSTSGSIETFFKELSNTYELCKLGKHSPIGGGVIHADFDNDPEEEVSDWFSKLQVDERDLSTSGIMSKLRSYAAQMKPDLAKTIAEFLDERHPPYDPHADRFDSSPTPNNPSGDGTPVSSSHNINRTFNNLLSTSATTTSTHSHASAHQTSSQGVTMDSSMGGSSGGAGGISGYSSESQIQLDAASQSIKSQTLINLSGGHGTNEDNIYVEDEANKQTGIAIYMIDPFSSPSTSQNLTSLATIGLMKCYSQLLDQLPENLKRITQLQIISLDSIVSHARPIINLTKVDQLKSLSMNVYSRCRKILTNQITAKSLTGFGPAAALDAFFKTKSADICVSKMFTPPFILAPMKDKQTELGEMFGDRREKSSVLFCTYCITEDQRWLIATATNDKGEMSESTVININIVDRMKRPRTSVRRVALRKLMEFVISVMADWVNPWRLIIGRMGRLGHGELKEWATLLSKRSLLNYSRHLTERCRQCSVLPPTETVSILSACLVSLEPDSKLRIMPDQFTSDDRQASFNKCQLSTPEDASTTHILVFPTSASIQSSHGQVEDPLAGSGLDDDLLNQFPLEVDEDLGVGDNMDDLFSAWDDNPTNVSDNINSHHDTMMSSSSLQIGSGVPVGDSGGNQDETLQLLQQPLALGYYISTAKIGQMPNWFWATSPHLRNSCPVFLKSALHIHLPCVQLSDDLLHSGVGQTRKSHQLDSNLTTDVLRYVLEGYNSLSWLALNPKNYDRQSCLPVHMQNLLQLYHLIESFS